MPSVQISASSSGDNTLVAAPVATQFIRVFGFSISANGTVNVTLKSGSTSKAGPYYFSQFGGIVRDNTYDVFDCAPGDPLILNLSGSVAVGGEVAYTLIGLQ